MAYTKNTWATDDIITAPKLNNIESGLEFATNGIANTFTDFNTVANAMTTFVGNWKVTSNVVKNGPNGDTSYSHVSVSPVAGNGGYITVVPLSGIGMYVGTVSSGVITWFKLAKDTEAVKLTGDQTVSGNKTFSGTTNTTGYLKQKRWSTTASIGGNTFILNRIGDVVFASGQVTTVLTGETTASGTLPTGFRPHENFVISTNRGVGTGTLLFQKDGSVWVPATVNVDSYISGTYLAEDTLPTI